MRTSARLIALCTLVALSHAGLARAVFAQTRDDATRTLPPPMLWIAAPRAEGREPKSAPVTIERLGLEIDVQGFVAETTVTMTFANPNARALEGELYFPLPADATIAGYALDVDGVLVDGVAIERDRARVVFEKEVRKGVDPGLVEWTRGNVFRTRIYPIPAQGRRTVRVRFLSELGASEGSLTYRLPLAFKERIQEATLHVSVWGAAPVVAWPHKAPLAFKRKGSTSTVTGRAAASALSGELVVKVPIPSGVAQAVETTPEGERFFAARQSIAGLSRVPPVPRRAGHVAIVWDASGSRAGAQHERALAFLEAYFADKGPSTTVDVTILRNVAEPPTRFVLSGGKLGALGARLRGLDYDGGTQLGALTPRAGEARPDLVFFFTDGLSTFGAHEPRFEAPVYALSVDQRVHRPLLEAIAERTGGRYIDLLQHDAKRGAQLVGAQPLTVARVTVESGVVTDVRPRPGEPVDDDVTVAGRLESDAARIRVDLGVGATHVASFTFDLSATDTAHGTTLATLWAQRRVQELAAFPKQNRDELVALGRRYGLVTPETSLLVLERLEQYVEHEVRPPAQLEAMRRAWDDTKRAQLEDERRDRASKLEHILALWNERVAWWETKFRYPPGFRYRDETSKKRERTRDGEGLGDIVSEVATGRGGASLGAGGAPSSAALADPREEADKVSADMPEAKAANGKNGATSDADDVAAAIEVAEWNPEMPYLAAIAKAGKAKAFSTYLAQKKDYGASPAFYFDVAEHFFRAGETARGVQVLSNVAELELDAPSLLRIAAYRLSQLGERTLAIALFDEVLDARPEEPQSYRDLALVLADDGQYARAMDLLLRVVMQRWDRFDQIELIALMELNAILPKARAAGVPPPKDLDPRLVKKLDLDVRITLSWDTDLTDVDLWVLEPSGEQADYSHNRTTIGGLVSSDFTQGYGPEEYVLRRAMKGRYTVKANFYGSSEQRLSGGVTLKLDLITNFGRPSEKRRTLTLRLTETKETFTVGALEF